MPLTAEPTAASSPRAGRTLAQVVRVIDGDTTVVATGGLEYRVRYIGIDTPETVDPRKPVECYGREASQRNRELVEGETVELEKDVSETDQYDRLLRYVWVDGEMVNAILVSEGYAVVVTYPPDVKYQELFLELQRQARAEGQGLWSACLTPTVCAPEGPICD
jgi:micrococcal nuclease